MNKYHLLSRWATRAIAISTGQVLSKEVVLVLSKEGGIDLLSRLDSKGS